MVVLPARIQENGNNMSDNIQAVILMVWLSSETQKFHITSDMTKHVKINACHMSL
jgi:hypothetical protein